MSAWPVEVGWGTRRAVRVASRRTSHVVARAVAHPAAPAVVLALGMLAASVATALISVRVVSHTFDEDLFRASAAHYAYDGLPGALFHDLFARGPARLYALLMSPLFALANADVAVRIAHVVSCLLFASAAIPAYRLARLVVRSRWSAVLAGLGSILVPWSALASTMYTENLAYPLFLWSLLAQWRAVDRPSPGRDLMALGSIVALITTRTQFAIVLPIYLTIIGVRELSPDRRGQRWRFGPREGLLRLGAAYPFTTALSALAVLGVTFRAWRGQLHQDVARVLGDYSEIQDRQALGQQYSTAVTTEVLAVGFGTGIVPAVVGAGWYVAAIAGRLGRRAREFSLLAVIAVVGLVAFTVYAQGGWLRNATEERYYIYVVPLLWVGLAAALERRGVTRAVLGAAAAVLVLCIAATDILDVLDDSYAFLAPVHAILSHLVPVWLSKIGARSHFLGTLSPLDFRVFLALGLAAVTVWAWGRGAALRRMVVAAALAGQVAFAAYAWATIDGHVAGVPGRTGSGFAALGWIDRSAGGQTVRWLDNQDLHDPVAARNQQTDTAFYNDHVRRMVVIPALNRPVADPTLAGLSQDAVRVDPAGRAAGLPAGLAVSTVDSPVLQLDAPAVRRNASGQLELLRVPPAPRVLWSATGLQGDNWLANGQTARLRVGAGITRIRLEFARPPRAGSRIAVEIDGHRRSAPIAPGSTPKVWSFDVCGPTEGILAGTAAPDPAGGPALAAALTRVTLVRGRC